ncbi:MAG: FHA domain-containing protein [Myxococcota bacterium]
MLTWGDLEQSPDRVDELDGDDILVQATGASETVVREEGHEPKREATIIFRHETIQMMMADRASELDKLRAVLNADYPVVPLRKRPGSPWDHVTVGRSSSADILIDDPAISNVHAHFELDPDAELVSVQDVGSSTGTFVNRRPLQPYDPEVLTSGDCVRFGQTIFYFVTNQVLVEMLGPSEDVELEFD